MPLLLVHFARYGEYHRARLRTAMAALAPHGWEVLGLEIASTDSTYAWDEVVHPTEKDTGEPRVITAFPGRVYEEITAAEYRRVLHPLLDRLAPDAVAIAGWGSVDAVSCLSWCRRHGVRRILMSETRHADGRRMWWKEFLKARIVRRFDAALVGGKSHRDYLVKLGLPADKIRLGYNVVDNGYFAAEAERWREKTQDCKTQDAREEGVGGNTQDGKTQDTREEGVGEKTQDGKTQDAREDADGGGLAAEEMPGVGGGLTRGETPRETAWRETRQPLSARRERQRLSVICDQRSTILPYFLASNRFIERKNLARLVDAYAVYVESYQLSVSGYQEREDGAAGLEDDLQAQVASHEHLAPLATSGPARRSSPTGAWNLCLLGDGELKADLIEQCMRLELTVIECAPWESSLTPDSCPLTPGVGSDGLGRTLAAPEGEMQLEGKCSGDSLASHPVGDKWDAPGGRALPLGRMPSASCLPPSAACPKPPFVFFPGFRQIDELPRFYAHAGAFVHPAMEEPWGLVINEAMACGLPVLSSRNVGAAEELVDEGVNGWVFDPASVAEITDCLCRVAEMSDEARLAMGAACVRILEERCPAAAFGRGLAELLAR